MATLFAMSTELMFPRSSVHHPCPFALYYPGPSLLLLSITSSPPTVKMVYAVKDMADFDKQLADAGSKIVVVDFHAQWCGPCKIIAPKIEAMSKEKTNVVFIKVDVDECEDVALKYKISCMPTFVLFKDGDKIDSFSGASEDKLKETLAKYDA